MVKVSGKMGFILEVGARARVIVRSARGGRSIPLKRQVLTVVECEGNDLVGRVMISELASFRIQRLEK